MGKAANIRETTDSKRELVYKLWGLQKSERENVFRAYPQFQGILLDNLNQNIEKILRIAEEEKLLQKILQDIGRMTGTIEAIEDYERIK